MANKMLVNLSRFIFAAVFLFSGFVKAIDPIGTVYQIESYLSIFGPFFESFKILAFPAAIALPAIEIMIAINLIFGILRTKTTIMAIAVMSFFLPLTLYIAIFDPIPSCGCFGDALKITNWQTFGKNVVLITLAIVLFLNRRNMKPLLGNKTKWFTAIYAFVFSVALSLYCLMNLPIIDFRPYKIGNNIPEGMQVPEGAPVDIYEHVFILERDGVREEFTLENFPAGDPSWTFVDRRDILIQRGYEPPINNFFITLLPDEEDITYDVLLDENYTFLMIAYNLERVTTRRVQAFNEIYAFAREHGYAFYCLTASPPDVIEDFIQITGAKFPMAVGDEVTLMTIIRANPGLVLLKNGTVINMWHHRNLPVFDAPLESSKLGQIPPNREVRNTLAVSAILFVPIIIPALLRVIFKQKRRNGS